MGGVGSGRYGRAAGTVESAARLDASRLVRAGAGLDKFRAALKIEGGGYAPSRVEIEVTLDREDASGSVQITHYELRPGSTAVATQSYTVALVGIPCHLGGLRWLFACPRTWARVTRLYLPLGASRFASRDAWRLTYQSKRSDRIQRGHGRLARAYAKLGGSYSTLGQRIPDKPKWMRWATYERLVVAIGGAQSWHLMRCNSHMAERDSPFLRRTYAEFRDKYTQARLRARG